MRFLDRIGTYRIRQALGHSVQGAPALVLASAPEPVLPAGFDEQWSLFCVNASGRSARQLGLPRPHVTLISGRMLGDREVNREGQQAIAGLETATCIIVERGIRFSTALQRLRELDFRFEHAVRMTHREWERILRLVLGRELGTISGERKISTGLFTGALALYLQGSPVLLSGFSLTRDGHAYSGRGFAREHKDIDTRAIELMVSRGWPIATADPALHRESGLSLVP